MSPEEALAAALPCDDPEEPCDTDGRGPTRWCNNCIARSVVYAEGYTIVRSDELARLRAVEEAARALDRVATWSALGRPEVGPLRAALEDRP